MKALILGIVLALAACGKEPPKVLTMKDVKAAALGGWESGCLPIAYADTPIEGASSVKFLMELTHQDAGGDTPWVLFYQSLFLDTSCASPLATVKTISWGEIKGIDDRRFTLRMETGATYLNSHLESLTKRYVFNDPEIVAKYTHSEHPLFGSPFMLDYAEYGDRLLFGGEVADSKLTLFLPSSKQFTRGGKRETPPPDFKKAVPMLRRY